MIFNSTPIMTAIDVTILGVVLAALVFFAMHAARFRKYDLIASPFLIVLGLLIIGGFYSYDLILMHLFPYYMADAEVMNLMTDLHLNQSWIVKLLGTALIVSGFLLLGRKLIAIAEKLGATETHLQNANAGLTTMVDERTAALQQEITERKYMEQSLLEQEQRHRAVIDNAADAIFVIDITDDYAGRFVEVNKAACEGLGYSREELLTMSVPDIEAGLSQSARDLSYNSLDAGKVATLNGIHRRKDGTTFPVLVRSSVVELDGRKFSMALARDETERLSNERELEMARIEAETANRSKSEFLTNMSHELRTSLNAIIGFSESLSQERFGPLNNAKQEEYLDNIRKSGELLLELINDILDVSAIEADKLGLSESNVNLATVFAAATRLVMTRAQERGIEISGDFGGADAVIRADERRMLQILVNLLSNAVKFNKAGGAVSVSAEIDPGGAMILAITDTGIGMSASDIDRAMQPFGQTHSGEAIDHEGTGLGLPLTKKLVEAQGGSMAIESRPGSGTTVRIRIPADRVVRAKERTRSRFPRSASHSG